MKLTFATLLLVAASSMCAAATPPSDAEIAHIAYTAGVIDIEAAQDALDKAHDPSVREFAQTMLRDHEAVNEQALALLEKLSVTPLDNPTSQALTEGAREFREMQADLEGVAFDRAYVAREAAFHAQVNDALRSALIPGARNSELKSLLEDGLALFSEHQKHAEALVGSTP